MKIFLSYSRQDHEFKDEIKKTLSKLERDSEITLWVDDKELKAGDLFNEVIEKELKESDIFLLLLSRDFWASDYIQTKELPFILQSSIERDAIVVPIVLKDTYDLLNYDEIQNINAIPREDTGDKTLKPIAAFDSKEKAYNIVLKEIKNIIISSKNYLPYIELSRYCLKTLNPYNELEKIELKEINHIQINTFEIKIIEHYQNKEKIDKTLAYSYSEDAKHILIHRFRNSKQFNKIKNQLKNQKIITKYQILNYLDSTLKTLFPVPSKIKKIESIIETEDIKSLTDIIKTTTSKKLLVYGSAGVGKTSTLSSLKSNFPDGLVIMYDSFGGGTYKDFGSQRHLQKKILTQLINEIAIVLGLELLLEQKFNLYDLELKLKEYIDEASNILSDKKVIFIIDAADNNVDGARHFGEEPYIPKLWSINLPSNCYLIMSARGGLRKDSLLAPIHVAELELKGFNLEASTQLLSQYFPKVDKEVALLFHKRTNGTPRVEDYLLQQVNGDYKKLKAVLEKDETISLEHIFDDMWVQALAVIEPITREHVEELICLSRPAKLEDFTLASGLNEEESFKIIKTLEPGITINEKNGIGFQDEDFETFLSIKVDENITLEAHKRIANNLLPSIGSDVFATKYIAFHLEKAQEYDSLIHVTLFSSLSHITDRLEQKEIQKDRVKRALKAALDSKDYKSVYKLLFIVSEIIRSDESLNEFLQDSPELLSIYTSEENAVSYYTSSFIKLENFSYRCAYLLSRTDPERATEFLKIGDAWLKDTLDEKDKNGVRGNIDTSDMAKRSIAVYHTKGIKEAIESFSVWQLWFLIQVIDELPKDFLLEITTDKQEEIYSNFHKEVHPFVQAQLLVLLNNVGNTPSKSLVNKVANRLYKYINLQPEKIKTIQNNRNDFQRDDFNKISIDFSILALMSSFDKKLILPVLLNTSTKSFEMLYDDYSLKSFSDTFLALTLKSEIENKVLNLDDLIQENKNENYTKKEEKKRKIELIRDVISYYHLYAKTIVNQLSFDDIREEWNKLLFNATPSWHNRNREHTIISIKFEILTKILIILNGDHAAFSSLVKSIKGIVETYNVIYQVAPILLDGRYLNEAFELIDLAIVIAQKEASPAREKVDLFSGYAEFVRFYDAERARYYFELALEATSGLDDNVYFLYKLITSLTKYALPELTENEKVALVNRNINIVESILGYLYETEGVVLKEAIKIVSQLDFSLALAVAQKWDSDIIYKLEDSLSEIIPVAIQNGDLTNEELFSLRYLVKNSNIIDSFLLILDKLNGDKKKLFDVLENMVTFIRKNLVDKDQPSSLLEIKNWLEKNNYTSHKITLQLKKYDEFFKTLDTSPNVSSPSYSHSTNIEDWDEFFKPYLSNIPNSLKEMDKKVSGGETSKLLLEARGRLTYNQKILWLEAICELDIFYIKSYIEEFIYCLSEWESDINVKKSIDKLIEKFINKHSSRLLDSKKYLYKLYKYKSKDEIFKILLKEELRYPFASGLRSIYALMDTTKEILSWEDAKEIVFDSISRLESHLEIDSFILSKESSNKKSLANFLWKLLGHPDRRIRWKARHATRELLKENSNYVPLFIAKLSSTDGFPFTDDLSFYTISAKESLLIVFHRLSCEIQELLKPYIPNFRNIVFDEKFPHIVIREIAKAIVLNLSEDRDMKLLLANEPHSCFLKKELQGYGHNHDTRFRFDSMDTIPYWYNYMQNIFNIEMIKILKKAEVWIIDKWGQDDSIRDKHLRNRWERDNYHLTSHRHGGLPTIEEPIRHLEFEAMFLVAGELLKTDPVNISRYTDDNHCEYRDFLNGYFKDNDFWYSEFRQSKPLETFLWGIFNKENNLEKFDNLLGVGGSSLVLHGYYNVYTERYSETIDISSALVLPETSDRLLKILQKADPYDYHLPTTNVYETVKYKECALIGWVDDESEEFEKDSHDPYLHKSSCRLYVPAEDFIKVCKLSWDKYKEIYTSGDTEIIKIERWMDEEDGDSYEKFSSSGNRMWVDIDSMLFYLKQKNMDLMIEIQISTNSKDIGEDEKEYNKKTIIYLLRREGTIEREGKCFELGDLKL